MKDFSYKALWIFSIPSILSSLLEPMANVVDNALVGNISTHWLAALAVSSVILNSFTWIFNFLIHGSTQLIASHQDEHEDSSLLAGKVKMALGLAFIVGVVCSLVLFFLSDFLFTVAGGQAELKTLFEEYFFIRLIGHPFTVMYITLVSVLRGFSRVKESFYLVLFTTLLNVLLTYLFLNVFQLGLAGAAYGTIISTVIGFLMAFVLVYQNQSVKKYLLSSKLPEESMVRFGKNSVNLFGRSFSLTLAFFISTRLSGLCGVVELATHQILLQAWLFSSFLLDGVAITGNIWGAKLNALKRFDDLKICFNRLLKMGLGIGVIFSIIYFIFQQQIISIFTYDKNVFLLAFSVWPIVYLSQIPSSLAFVYDGLIFGLEGYGFLRKHMMIGVALVFIPMATLTHINKTLMGVWLALAFLNLYRGVSGFYFVNRFLNGVRNDQ